MVRHLRASLTCSIFTSPLRSSDEGLLVVPRAQLRTIGDCAFEVVAPTMWNTLPIDIRSAVSVGIFKKQLIMYSFKLAFVSPLAVLFLLFYGLIFKCFYSCESLCELAL